MTKTESLASFCERYYVFPSFVMLTKSSTLLAAEKPSTSLVEVKKSDSTPKELKATKIPMLLSYLQLVSSNNCCLLAKNIAAL